MKAVWNPFFTQGIQEAKNFLKKSILLIYFRNVGWNYHRKNFKIGLLLVIALLVQGSYWNSFRTNPIYYDLFQNLSQVNPNPSESIREKRSISFDVNRLKINPSQSEIFNPNQNSILCNFEANFARLDRREKRTENFGKSFLIFRIHVNKTW